MLMNLHDPSHSDNSAKKTDAHHSETHAIFFVLSSLYSYSTTTDISVTTPKWEKEKKKKEFSAASRGPYEAFTSYWVWSHSFFRDQ